MRRFYWTALLLTLMLVSGPSTAQVAIDPSSSPAGPPRSGAPDGSATETPADPEAGSESDADGPPNPDNYQSHMEKSPHQLWVELQAIHAELKLNAAEFNYDPLPELGREFGAHLWALLATTHDDLPIPNQVMAKRITAVGGEVSGRWARAAAMHWPDSLRDPLLFTDSLMRGIVRAYPPELLDPPAAQASGAESPVGDVAAPGSEATADSGPSSDD